MMKAIILDIDGVVLLGKTQVKGAAEAIEKLRVSGFRIFFLTNNGGRSRRSLLQKLLNAGISAVEEECYPASYGVADYISKKYPNAGVYAISSGGLEEELRLKGLNAVDDENADVVAVAFDSGINYEKLTKACRALLKGAVFIASNEDRTFPVEDGLKPGAGAIVAGLRFSTGKRPSIVIGKPNAYLIKTIMREHHLKKEEIVIVGDTLETDIMMAKNARVKSVLVLSGNTGRDELEKDGKIRPELVLKDITELPSMIKKIQ